MNYLIDPIVFYVIGVLSNLNLIFAVLLWILVLCVFVATIFMIMFLTDRYTGEEEFEELISKFNSIKKRCIVIPILTIVLFAISIPSEETMTKMLVASQLNEKNYTLAKEEIIELIDYISEKIDK